MLNKVQLIGRLGADPIIKHLDNNKNVATLNVATEESFKKDDGEWETVTEWHRVVVWNRAQSIEKRKKGDRVYIEGKMKTRQWDDNGVTKYATEVVGICKAILDKKETSQPATNPQQPTEQKQDSNVGKSGLPLPNFAPEPPTPTDGDIPF